MVKSKTRNEEIWGWKQGFVSLTLNWSAEEQKPTIRIQVWKIGVSINFFFG